MGLLVNLTGKRFGKLVVEKRVENNKHKKAQFLCRCDCGNERVILGNSLMSGKTQSCGCFRKVCTSQRSTTHHLKKSRLYRIWLSAKNRCLNPNNQSYKDYGGRGITMCEDWANNFMAFHDWAFANGYDETAPRGQCTIDRIDVNGNYEPSNCRWVPMSEQTNNRRNTNLIVYNGESLTRKQLSIKYGVSYASLTSRLKEGWDIEKAITTLVQKRIKTNG